VFSWGCQAGNRACHQVSYLNSKEVSSLAISREKKSAMIDTYVDLLKNAQAVFVTEYRGMTVVDITNLRRKIEAAGGTYVVVKNTLFKRAMEQVGMPVPQGLLEGPVAVGIVPSEFPAVARTLNETSLTMELLVIKGGVLGARQFDKSQMVALANMPSREVLLSQVLAGLQAPIAGLVNVLNGPIRGLVYVLQARQDQLSPAEG
jgi:large subunit ribosomal protein L10